MMILSVPIISTNVFGKILTKEMFGYDNIGLFIFSLILQKETGKP
jgi:hypothetical protein